MKSQKGKKELKPSITLKNDDLQKEEEFEIKVKQISNQTESFSQKDLLDMIKDQKEDMQSISNKFVGKLYFSSIKVTDKEEIKLIHSDDEIDDHLENFKPPSPIKHQKSQRSHCKDKRATDVKRNSQMHSAINLEFNSSKLFKNIKIKKAKMKSINDLPQTAKSKLNNIDDH